MSNAQIDYGDETELVKSIDEELDFIENMYLDGSSCLTLRVQRGDKECVLKVRKRSNNVWDSRYFFYEIHALRRASERNLQGVNRLLKSYDQDDYQGVLKPFIKGTPGNQREDSFQQDPEFVKKLDKLYLRLHLAGISNINFLPRKIVFTNAEDFILVDLSTCLVNTEVGIQQFNLTMKEDSKFITRLERQIERYQQLDRRRTYQ